MRALSLRLSDDLSGASDNDGKMPINVSTLRGMELPDVFVSPSGFLNISRVEWRLWMKWASRMPCVLQRDSPQSLLVAVAMLDCFTHSTYIQY